MIWQHVNGGDDAEAVKPLEECFGAILIVPIPIKSGLGSLPLGTTRCKQASFM